MQGGGFDIQASAHCSYCSEVKRIGSSLARQTAGEEGEVYYFSNLLFWLRLTLNIADMTGMNDIFK